MPRRSLAPSRFGQKNAVVLGIALVLANWSVFGRKLAVRTMVVCVAICAAAALLSSVRTSEVLWRLGVAIQLVDNAIKTAPMWQWLGLCASALIVSARLLTTTKSRPIADNARFSAENKQ